MAIGGGHGGRIKLPKKPNRIAKGGHHRLYLGAGGAVTRDIQPPAVCWQQRQRLRDDLIRGAFVPVAQHTDSQHRAIQRGRQRQSALCEKRRQMHQPLHHGLIAAQRFGIAVREVKDHIRRVACGLGG